MPLKWFRRKKPEDVAPLTRAPETPEPDHLTVAEPAEGPDGQSSTDAAAKKRRRGTRGGRNRKKSTATAATVAPCRSAISTHSSACLSTAFQRRANAAVKPT